MINPPKKRKISRRTFTRLILTGAIGGGIAVAELTSRPLGILGWLGVNFRRIGKGFGENSTVAIVNAPSYEVDLLTPLRAAWDLIKAPEVAGKRVVLKPNLIYNVPGYVINTDVAVIAAAISLLQEKGAKEVIVAEGTAYQRDILDLLYSSGIGPMLDERGVRFVDLNHDDIVRVASKGNYTGRGELWVPKTIAEADLIISMPKLKTHHWASVTLSMKNLYGIVPGVRYGWPKNNLHVTGIDTNIVELYQTIAPQMAIVDGIVGMEDDGPLFGKSRTAGVLVMGTDLVAVDATCTRIMGFEPTQQVARHIWYGEWLGLGQLALDKIKIVGTPLATVRQSFVPPPNIQNEINRY